MNTMTLFCHLLKGLIRRFNLKLITDLQQMDCVPDRSIVVRRSSQPSGAVKITFERKQQFTLIRQ